MSAPILLTANSLPDDEIRLISELQQKLDKYRPVNALIEGYYEGSHRVNQLKISIPPALEEQVRAVVGWPGTTVDVLEERLDFIQWNDPVGLGLQEVFDDNELGVESGLAHLDALTYGCGFVCVGSGGAGEPTPLVTVESALTTTGLWDPRRRRLTAALSVHSNDLNEALWATLYLPDSTIHLSRVNVGSPWRVDDRDDHNLGRVPVVQLVNKPRSGRREGRSEITRAVRGYTDTAVRTLMGMEVNREFYSAPQRYVLGAGKDAFVDDAGNPIPAWQTIMGRIWGLERDENGELPEVAQFPASSPGPYLEQIRGLAQLLAAEAAIPPTYLGFATDQAASADAIRAMEARLVKRAERRQTVFGLGWLEVARLALLVRDGRIPDEFRQVSVKWRDASTPTRSATADEATKLVAAQVLPPDSSVTYDRIGLTPVEQRQLKADKRAAGMGDVVARLRMLDGGIGDRASTAAEPTAPADRR